MIPRLSFLLSTTFLLAAPLAHAEPRQAQTIQASPVAQFATQSAGFSRFTPRPSKRTKIDYEIWDVALKEFVVYGGPSLRRRASPPKAVAGSRFVLGHTSPYRLEGNKVAFEGMKRDFETYLDAYATDLIAVGNRIDIPALSRNEQLAYWINLHNVLVVREIAKRYPIEYPSRIRGKDGLGLQDTKLVTIDGVSLSLRNIREDIVYANWSDPNVIYGFFRGELGSPSLQRAAYTGLNVRQTLSQSGREFAASLRGVERYGDILRVSKVYEEAAPYYFPDFDADLRAHLVDMGSPESQSEIRSVSAPLQVARYPDVIADLTAGDADRRPASAVTSTNRNGGRVDNSAIARAVREQNEKYNKIRERGLNAIVIIEDIETDADQGDFIDPSED